MVVTTAVRTAAKLERKVFEPHWLREVVDDGDAGFLIESGEQIAYVNRLLASNRAATCSSTPSITT